MFWWEIRPLSSSVSRLRSISLQIRFSHFSSQLQLNFHNRRRIMNVTTIDRGLLIIFEGLDRCGKSTQSRKLHEAITKAGQPAKLWAFPDRTTKLGGVINDYLSEKLDCDDRAIHLLFSANRWEKVPALLKLLNSGTTVIIDRYAFSGVAYSAAKGVSTNQHAGASFLSTLRQTLGDALPLNWCKQPDVGLPKPDCVIFLQLSPEVGKQRSGFGEERYEKTKFQDKVREQFQQIQDETWKVIDADQTIEDLHEEIYKHIKSLKKEPLQGLWN